MWVALPARGLAAFWGPGGDSGSHRCFSRGGGRWVKGPCGFSPPPGSRHQPGPGCARRTKGAPGCLTPANILGPSLFTAARASTKPRIVSSGAPRAPESVSAFCKGGEKRGREVLSYFIFYYFFFSGSCSVQRQGLPLCPSPPGCPSWPARRSPPSPGTDQSPGEGGAVPGTLSPGGTRGRVAVPKAGINGLRKPRMCWA